MELGADPCDIKKKKEEIDKKVAKSKSPIR